MKAQKTSTTFAFVLLLIQVLFYGALAQDFDKGVPPGNTISLAPTSPHENIIKLAVAGDIMMDRKVRATIEAHDNDYTLPFLYIRDELEGIDIKIANLEAPITESKLVKKKVIPCKPGGGGCCGFHCHFKTKKEVMNGLFYAGFNLLLLENNHMDDYYHGREDTIKTLNANNMPWVDAEHSYKMIDYKGCNLTFFNYDAVVRKHTEESIKTQLKADLKKKIHKDSTKIVLIHAGKEYAFNETLKQKRLARVAIDNGADIVLFSHAHVVLGHEMYKEKWIFWGLGNFVFDQFFNDRVKQFLMVKFDLLNCKQVVNVQKVMGVISKSSQPMALDYEMFESTIFEP